MTRYTIFWKPQPDSYDTYRYVRRGESQEIAVEHALSEIRGVYPRGVIVAVESYREVA